MMALPADVREALVGRVIARAGQVSADFTFEPAVRARNARSRLAAALASRLAAASVALPPEKADSALLR